MKKQILMFALCCLTACSSSSATKENEPEEQPKNVYRNPVINYSLPDPSVIKGGDGYYYLYATEDIRKSADSPFQESGGLGICRYCLYRPYPT